MGGCLDAVECSLRPRTHLVYRCALEALSICASCSNGSGLVSEYWRCVHLWVTVCWGFFRMMHYRNRMLDNYMLWLNLHFYILRPHTEQYILSQTHTRWHADTQIHVYPSFSWGHCRPVVKLSLGGWGAVSVWKTALAQTSPHSVCPQCAKARSCVHRHKHTNWNCVHQISSDLWDLRQNLIISTYFIHAWIY